MSKHDSLHELIHAMTGQEKRYFKIFIGQKRGTPPNKYGRLFDLLLGMESFDTGKLQEAFGWKNFRSSYTMAKKYLHDKILESLAAYQNNETIVQQLETLIKQIRILRSKHLNNQTSRKIALAKRLAYKIQDHIHLLEILIEERNLMVHDARSVFQGDALLELNKEMEATTDLIRLEQKVQHLHYQFFTRMSHPTGEVLPEIGIYIDELKKLKVLQKKAFHPKISYLTSLNQYYFFKGEYAASQKTLAKAVDLFESHSIMITEYPSRYLGLIHNYGNRSILINKYVPALECLHLLRDFPIRNKKIENQRLESYFGMGLLLILNSGQTRENESFLQMILLELSKSKPRLSKRLLLNLKWMIAIWYLQAGDFKKALTWTQEVYLDPAHSSIKIYSRLIGLIEMLIHFDMGNEEWLEYRLRSKQNLLKQGAPFAFEKVFLLHLKELIHLQDSRSRHQTFVKLLADIRLLSQEPNEHPVFSFFDFEAWTISKVEGLTFQRAIQQDWESKNGIEIRV